MSTTITCPVCGRRNIYEFRFGGENRGARPFDSEASPEEWYSYVHLRNNAAGPQQEWWYHRDGCGVWFTIWRDVTNDIEVEMKEKAI
jgi:sarcosine oxidase subunit delta